jgi:hypothetical protein
MIENTTNTGTTEKPLTPSEKLKAKLKADELELLEEFEKAFSNTRTTGPNTTKEDIYNIKIEEKEDLLPAVKEKLLELIPDLVKRGEEQEKRGNIMKKIVSISVDNKKAIFTFDYFDTIETEQFIFSTGKWEILPPKTKPEFNR